MENSDVGASWVLGLGPGWPAAPGQLATWEGGAERKAGGKVLVQGRRW